MQRNHGHIPALHFDWLTPWYDRFIACLYPEARIKGDLIEQANLAQCHRILDVGCGTATLTLMLKQAQPAAEVHGLDVDAKILAIARTKAQRMGVDIVLDSASATALPYPDGCYDRVFASLMLHHLKRADKRQALKEAWRVLKPGGELHVLDFGVPEGPAAVLIALLVGCFEETSDAIHGQLPLYMEEAGFRPVEETHCYATVSGTLRAHRACKPARA